MGAPAPAVAPIAHPANAAPLAPAFYSNGVTYIPLPPNPPAPPPSSVAAVSPALMMTFGPIGWGKDITWEFRSFLQLLPSAASIHAGSVCAHDRHGDYIFVSFTSEGDCDRFIRLWATNLPSGYPGITTQKN
jgi:hypothetical protein